MVNWCGPYSHGGALVPERLVQMSSIQVILQRQRLTNVMGQILEWNVHGSATTLKPPTLVCLMPRALMQQAMRRAPLKWSRDIWHWDPGTASLWSCGVWEGRLHSGHGCVAYHECPVGMGFVKLPWAFCHVALSIPEQYLWCGTFSRCTWALVFL